MNEKDEKETKGSEQEEKDYSECCEPEEELKKKEKEISRFEDLLEEKEERIKELESLVKRTKADFENFKKKRRKEEEKIKKRARQDILKKFMDLFDGLRSAEDLDIYRDPEKSLKEREKEELKKINKGLYEGIENVLKQFGSILEEEGIEVVNPEGEKFDPNLHEAIKVEEREDQEDNKVAEVLQVGYKSSDRVIRPARVIVYKNDFEGSEDENSE